MMTLQKRKIFAYIAIVLPLLGALGCLIANIVMNDFLHFDDNPLPKNIFDLPSLVLVIFWIVGGILVLTTKSWLTENDLLPHFRDSKGREWVVKDPDIMESMLSFVLPIILNVLVMPFLAVAIIYYPIYFLLSVVVAIFPWIVVAILISLLIWVSIHLYRQLKIVNPNQYLDILAGHSGFILITLGLFINIFFLSSAFWLSNLGWLFIPSFVLSASGAILYALSCYKDRFLINDAPILDPRLIPCQKGLMLILINALCIFPFRSIWMVVDDFMAYICLGVGSLGSLVVLIYMIYVRIKHKNIFVGNKKMKVFMVFSVITACYPNWFIMLIAWYVLPKCLYSASSIPLDDENSDNESQSLS